MWDKMGDFILESVGQWHTGANIGDESVKLLLRVPSGLSKKSEGTA
jgi:hypothetical protein